MAEADHIRGKKVGDFCACAVSGAKCDCGNNFRHTGKPDPWFFPFQAHHLLPVTCVNGVLVAEPEIDGILRATTWCINAKENMYGMPVWGHTVEWYCRITTVLRRLNVGQPAPVWKDIPQHLNDHNLYNEEVTGNLNSLGFTWAFAEHDAKGPDIAGDLKGLSTSMLSKRKSRGTRLYGGTHGAWTQAVEASKNGMELPGWYEDFSMAEEPCVRGFPIRGEFSSESSWIDRIAEAMCK